MSKARVDKHVVENKQKLLDKMIVKRTVENTNEFDSQINGLQKELDYFNYGIL